MKIYKTGVHVLGKVKILCGIKLDENKQVVFNYNVDDKDDIIHLVESTSGTFDKNGVKHVYAYQYNTTDAKARKAVRDYLKDEKHMFLEEVEDFVENGVLEFDSHNRLDEFSCVAHVESEGKYSLVDVMSGYVYSYISVPPIDVELIKQTYDEVAFDEEAARQACREHNYSPRKIEKEISHITQKFEDLKKSGKLFEMKRIVPPFIRVAFSNFLKFKSEDTKAAYKSMEGKKVLLFDDFITTGRTIGEAIRCLKSVNPDNEITVFVLIKQH